MSLPPGFVEKAYVYGQNVIEIPDPEAEAERLATERKVDQDQCVQRGGHCFDLTRESPDLLPGPCKHCGVRPGRGPTV